MIVFSLKSQTWTPLAKIASPYSSEIIQYDNFQIKRLGIGDDFESPSYLEPSAKFHMRELLSSLPVFKVEVKNPDESTLGFLKYLYRNTSGDTIFGTYQYGNSFINYYEGSIGSQSGMFFKGPNTSISIIQTNPFPITMTASPSGLVSTPIEIYRQRKVKIMDTLECTNFLLHDNAGLGSILVSDEKGNGIWMDPAIFNDKKWLINDDEDMYSNPIRSHIGIGFLTRDEKVYQKLHVVDGNILLSKLNGGNPSSLNGSILFGDEEVSDIHPNGKWGIEYYNEGLNFWQVYDRSDYNLFLKDDGTVGIGCNDTRGYKLAVKGNILCEEVLIRKYVNWPDYVFMDGYKLPPLHEIELFINDKHHLPDMPSTKEINEEGINISEISCVLVKKVEELTKYIIEQQKQIDDLKQKIKDR